MSVVDVSIRADWDALCERLDVSRTTRDSLWDLLVAMHAVPERAYHSLSHAHDCVTALRSIVDGDPSVESQVALWFHDCVYVPGHSENEAASAQVCAAACRVLGLDEDSAQTAASYVLATTHQGDPGADDARAVCDADMSILGSDPETYRVYSGAIRREWSHVVNKAFSEGRATFLRGLLSGTIYFTPKACDLFLEQAKTNIQNEVESLED